MSAVKTITMDFDLYLQELRDAKVQGFEEIPNLKVRLERLLASIAGYDRTELYRARIELVDMLNALNKDQE